LNIIAITSAHVRHEQTPLDEPVKVSFGAMSSRHAIFLIVHDDAGRQGIGESWVNFPAWAPWERVAAFERAIIPWMIGREVAEVPQFIGELYRAFAGPAAQSGALGPLLGALCAVELALWDLQAQAAGAPLATHLWGWHHAAVRVYASGLNSPLPRDLIDEHLNQGVKLFKLKLGFGDDEDRRNLDALRRHLGDGASIAVDVNRAWTLDDALRWLPLLREYDVQWLEEPLTPAEERRLGILRAESDVAIAGGENIMMPPGADVDEIAGQEWDILQPDLTKYAPLHVAKRLLDAARTTGKRVVPHFLGSGPGQAASLHFAAGCPEGLVELDINRNPLRTDLLDAPLRVVDGAIALPETPGLGWRLT